MPSPDLGSAHERVKIPFRYSPRGEGIGYATILMDKAADEIERLRAALRTWVMMAVADVRYKYDRPHPRGHHPYDGPMERSLELLGRDEQKGPEEG